MKVAILTIGDELLIGQVINTNAHWMSEKLTELGITVTHQLTMGDTFASINEALQILTTRTQLDPALAPDAVIIGGGLGPTHDDMTMEALSHYFKIPLEYDESWIAVVDEFFKSRNRTMTANNRKQGYLLKNAIRIDNDCGTAAGQHLILPKLDIFVVPGVPHEMKSMLERYVLPTLKKKTGGAQILKETLLVSGVGESVLALRCDPFVKKITELKESGKADITLAFLPNSSMVRLRLQMTVHSETEDPALFTRLVDELRFYCAKDFLGFDPNSLQDVVIQSLREQKKTVAITESCTGGLITHLLTQVSGSSEVVRGSLVAYQRILKETELGISPELIDQNGVVSNAVARAMAESIRKKWNADFGISTTGYLGPTGDAHAKAGTVWIAVATETETFTKDFVFEPNRERSKERAAFAALDLLRRNLLT